MHGLETVVIHTRVLNLLDTFQSKCLRNILKYIYDIHKQRIPERSSATEGKRTVKSSKSKTISNTRNPLNKKTRI